MPNASHSFQPISRMQACCSYCACILTWILKQKHERGKSSPAFQLWFPVPLWNEDRLQQKRNAKKCSFGFEWNCLDRKRLKRNICSRRNILAFRHRALILLFCRIEGLGSKWLLSSTQSPRQKHWVETLLKFCKKMPRWGLCVHFPLNYSSP